MAVFPIHYCGSIGYYQALVRADEVQFEIHEHFPKQTHRSRMEILGPNGVQKLVIPTQKTGQKRVMKDVRISYAENWQREHWKSLEAAYRNSPFFEHYESEIHDFYTQKTEHLLEFNLEFFEVINKLIKINFNYSLTEGYESLSSVEYRDSAFDLMEPISYMQVFMDRFDFIPNLSILDALFCLGPDTKTLIENSR